MMVFCELSQIRHELCVEDGHGFPVMKKIINFFGF